MIKTHIEFTCTWPKEDVQKIFDKLIAATGITELGLSMIFIQDAEQERITKVQDVEIVDYPEQESKETHAPESKHIETELTDTPEPEHTETEQLKPLDIPWPAKEEPHEHAEQDPDIFTEIERISVKDLGPVLNTSKPILTYAETKDGRVAIYYNEAPMYTTLATVRALPDKVPVDMVRHLLNGKRAALRGFKKHLTALDASENETHSDIEPAAQHDADVDPYAPILTGGAKVDTRSSGKVEGDLE